MDWVTQNWIEVVGYAGSIIVVVSLMMSNILTLRWINMVGGAVFSTYGLLLNAFPVFILNGLIVLIDIYYIIDIHRSKDSFSLLNVASEDPFLQRFLRFYAEDIQGIFPKFNPLATQQANHVIVLRNVVPVGIFIYQKNSDHSAQIILDYISPAYRDYKNAHYLIQTRRDQFLKEGIKTLFAESIIKKHQKYLQKIGFKQHENQENRFHKTL